MYPLTFASPSLPVFSRPIPPPSSKNIECVDQVWTSPICLQGSFLGTRSTMPSIQAGGVVHLKESVVLKQMISKGSMTGWYSQAQGIESESGVSLIGCKVGEVVARGGVSCKSSTAQSIKAHSLRLEGCTILKDVCIKESGIISQSTIQGCIRCEGTSLTLSDVVVRSIFFPKRSLPSPVKPVVHLYHSRVLGSVHFEDNQGTIISE